MKKYLMTVMAAVALGGLFTGCSKDADINGGANSAEFNIVQNYENAFITRFGQPAANQTWGFGEDVAGTRSGNMTGKERVAETSTGINANANEWADPTPDKTFGGWVVPDPLTSDQKDLVRRYFQSHTPLDYEDPHFSNFFVQQVYKGGTTKQGDTTEGIKGADGTQYSSDNMNLLTVGFNNQHINNFNAGTYSGQAIQVDGATIEPNADGTVNVLDKDHTANEFGEYHHKDQIMLMVNIDDTGCMGYHCSATGLSVQRNDKAALVGWETIRTWAREQGIYTEDILNDGWNRSFVGFDLALKSLEDSYKKENGQLVYARFDQVPAYNDFEYVWDGETVMKIDQNSAGQSTLTDKDFTASLVNASLWEGSVCVSKNGNIWEWNGKNFSVPVNNEDWTAYQEFVVEFDEPAPSGYNLWISGGWGGNYNGQQGDTEAVISVNQGMNPINSFGISNGNGTFKIKSVTLKAAFSNVFDSEYLIGDDIKIPFLDKNTNQYAGESKTVSESDWTYYHSDGKKCVNLKFFKDLYEAGWYPTTTSLREWAKWEDSDGYYSDWIVTLTEAKRQTPPEDPPYNPPTEPDDIVCRIIVEDLTVGENSDFDFNDVVFDVCHNGILIIRAIGGELPLYVGGKDDDHEVHNVCSIYLTGDNNKGKSSHTFMKNTGWGSDESGRINTAINYNADLGHIDMKRNYDSPEQAKEIQIWVKKASSPDPIELTAPVGKVASKVCVGTDYEWCSERQDIDKKFHTKSGVKLFSGYVRGQYTGKWQDKDGWYHHINDE